MAKLRHPYHFLCLYFGTLLLLLFICAQTSKFSIEQQFSHGRCTENAPEPSSTAVFVTPEAAAAGRRSLSATDGLKYIDKIIDDGRYNFTVAICAVVKDAEAYLQEWIDYNLLVMKFQHIYIYDNSDHFDLHRWYEQTRDHYLYSRVTVLHAPTTKDAVGHMQGTKMKHCVETYGKAGPKHDYMALIDVDEFLVPQQQQQNTDSVPEADIRDILNEYLVPYGGALTVNWMMVGTSNKSVYAPIPVTKRFQYREDRADAVIKTIVKSTDYRASANAHAVHLLNNQKVHTTLHPGAVFQKTTPAGASDPLRPSDVILLYHYRYTSVKEYLHKRCARGNIDDAKYGWCTPDGKLKEDTPDHIQHQPGTVFDDRPWRLLKHYAPMYGMYDQMVDFF